MAVYTRYGKVLDASGEPMKVREALALINQILDESLAEQESDFDADTRWALAWFEERGFAEGEFGVAEMLSKAKSHEHRQAWWRPVSSNPVRARFVCYDLPNCLPNGTRLPMLASRPGKWSTIWSGCWIAAVNRRPRILSGASGAWPMWPATSPIGSTRSRSGRAGLRGAPVQCSGRELGRDQAAGGCEIPCSAGEAFRVAESVTAEILEPES